MARRLPALPCHPRTRRVEDEEDCGRGGRGGGSTKGQLSRCTRRRSLGQRSSRDQTPMSPMTSEDWGGGGRRGTPPGASPPPCFAPAIIYLLCAPCDAPCPRLPSIVPAPLLQRQPRAVRRAPLQALTLMISDQGGGGRQQADGGAISGRRCLVLARAGKRGAAGGEGEARRRRRSCCGAGVWWAVNADARRQAGEEVGAGSDLVDHGG